MIYPEPIFLPGGDSSVFVEFGDAIDPALNRRVQHLMLALQREQIPGIIESVPAYRSLLIYFEPQLISAWKLRETIRALIQTAREDELPQPALIEIPALYGGEFGPDLEFVAAHSGLSAPEVVQIHTGNPYLIYMIGFIPGFPYLGGMSPKIATPRLETPRINIPAGSLGIAGSQTGIYPIKSPGGWRIIGRTPLQLFDPDREPPALFKASDYLSFVNISTEEFASIREAVEQGNYLPRRSLLETGDNGRF